MLIFSIILNLILLGIIIFLLFFLNRIGKSTISYEDQLQDIEIQVDKSLDIMRSHYQYILKLSNQPTMMDSPEVKNLVRSIKAVKEAIQLIAQKLYPLGAEANKKERDQNVS